MTPAAERSAKKLAVILNGISLRKKIFYKKILPALNASLPTEVFETRSKIDAVMLASKAVDEKFDVILAAGGDGTLHQVVNGTLHGREQVTGLPAIGLIPLGSANDFARTVNLRRNPENLVRLLAAFQPKRIDIGKLVFQDVGNPIHYFINIADTGMGPTVAEHINKGQRPFGASVAYYTAIVKAFFTYKPVEVEIKTESWNWMGKIRTLAIANGRSFGHGLMVAPDAVVDDGVFSIFLGEDLSVFDFIRYSGDLKKGKKVNHPKVHYRQARWIELSTPANLRLEADGELIGDLPVRIELLSKQLPFLY
jgi:diacylglycerol kinase (ATP)